MWNFTQGPDNNDIQVSYWTVHMKINVLGFCRFSFFGPSDTKLSYDDREKAFASLYSEQRMSTRFKLFEALLLPSIAAMENPDFMLHVMTSEVMPEHMRLRLSEICAPHKNVTVHFAKSEKLVKEIRPILKEASQDADRLVQFRIDDDDCLSKRYIDRLHHWGAMVTEPTIITMPKGIMLFDRDEKPKCQPFQRPMTGAGFAFVTPGPSYKTVFNFSHIQSAKRNTVLSDPSIHSHIQSFTSTADTKNHAKARIKQFSRQLGSKRSPEKLLEMTKAAVAADFPFITVPDLLALHADANLDQIKQLPKPTHHPNVIAAE